MAVKTIETRAVISAQDNTGQTFAQIAQKLKQFEKTSAQISQRATSRVQMAATARQVAMRGPAIASAVEGAIAGAAASRLLREIVQKSADQMHERARLATAGLSRDQMREVESTALSLSRAFPSVSQTDFMHQLRNVRSVVGSLEEATQIMEPLAKLRVIAQGARPGAKAEEINEDFDKLIKGLEIKGVTQDLPKFNRYVDGMAKALNVFGDTIRPYEYYEAFKYGRSATSGLSEAYSTSILPTLIQELKGSSAGKAQAAFYRAIVGGKMTNLAMREMVDLGLVDPKKIIHTKTGSIKGVQPGGIAGTTLAQSDPYLWTQQYLLPALAKKGVTDTGAINERIAHMFSNDVAAQLIQIFANQKTRIEKDRALVKGAQGLEGANTLRTESLKIAFEGLQTQIDNLAAAAGKPFLDPLTGLVNHMAELAGWTANKVANDPGKAVAGLATFGGIGAAVSWASAAGVRATYPWLAGTYGAGAGAGATARTLAPWLGRYLGGVGLAYGLYESERDTHLARGSYSASMAAFKPSEAQLLELERAKAEAERQTYMYTMSRRLVPGMLAGQVDALTARINTGKFNNALPGPNSLALGFGFGQSGIGGMGALKPGENIAAAITQGMSAAKVSLSPDSKATVSVNVKVEGGQITGLSSQSSGNIVAHPTAAGGVGKTSFSSLPQGIGHN